MVANLEMQHWEDERAKEAWTELATKGGLLKECLFPYKRKRVKNILPRWSVENENPGGGAYLAVCPFARSFCVIFQYT